MLSHLGIEVFVGGNLGTPLSEAAIQYLTCPSKRPPCQVIIPLFCQTASFHSLSIYALYLCHIFCMLLSTSIYFMTRLLLEGLIYFDISEGEENYFLK